MTKRGKRAAVFVTSTMLAAGLFLRAVFPTNTGLISIGGGEVGWMAYGWPFTYLQNTYRNPDHPVFNVFPFLGMAPTSTAWHLGAGLCDLAINVLFVVCFAFVITALSRRLKGRFSLQQVFWSITILSIVFAISVPTLMPSSDWVSICHSLLFVPVGIGLAATCAMVVWFVVAFPWILTKKPRRVRAARTSSCPASDDACEHASNHVARPYGPDSSSMS